MRTEWLCLTTALLLRAILCQGYPCCISFSRHVLRTTVRRQIVSYYVQKEDHNCYIEAVVFTIESGKKFCGDPKNASVKKVMAFVDARKRNLLLKTTAFRPDDIAIWPVDSCACIKTSSTAFPVSKIKNYCMQKEDQCTRNAVLLKKANICPDLRMMEPDDFATSTPLSHTSAFEAITLQEQDSGSVSSVSTCKCIQISYTSEVYNFYEQKKNCCNITTVVSMTPEGMRVCSVPLKAWTDILSVEARMWNSSAAALPLNTTEPTSNNTGQEFMEDSLQTLDTTPGLIRNLASDTFCMQITED